MSKSKSKTTLGETALRRSRRASAPLRRYDALPAPLRRGMSEAALPWSPASAEKLWRQARREGLDEAQALDKLARAEAKTLSRERPKLDRRRTVQRA